MKTTQGNQKWFRHIQFFNGLAYAYDFKADNLECALIFSAHKFFKIGIVGELLDRR